MRSLGLGLLLTIVGVALPAQSAPTVVGTWKLISMRVPDSTGSVMPTWDDRPAGLIMYSADGHMSAHLYDTRRAKLGANPAAADPAVARAAFLGLFTYFGRYTVDTVARTVTHTVAGAFDPGWVGGKLVRGYRFLPGNRIELTVVTDYTGARPKRPTVLVWERVGR